MTDFFEQNMDALSCHNTKLAKEIRERCAEDKQEENEYQVILKETREAATSLSIVDQDGQEHRMNSAYRPLSEAKRWADQYEFQNINIIVIMFGLGNGVFLRELYQRLGEDAKVFVYEPNLSLLLQLFHVVDFSEYFHRENFMLCVEGVNETEYESHLRSVLHWSNLKNKLVCFSPEYDKIFKESGDHFYDAVIKIDEIVQVDRNTAAYFAHDMSKNQLRNLHFLKESNYVSEFDGKIPEDIPAIIVAAGPSLDDNIEELKNAVGKAVIIATDTAVRRLLEHNIPFDCMVTCDPRKPSSYISDPRCADVPLFCIMESNNTIMEFHKGKKIWYQISDIMGAFYYRFDKNYKMCGAGGSVATAAFSVCVAMGVSRIVLIGQDLAYKGNVTHAGGEVDRILNEDEGVTMVESVDGGMVKTRSDWIYYKQWFETSILQCREIDVIDATEGGALIKGTRLMRLSEVIQEYCKHSFDARNLFETAEPTFTKEQYEVVKKELLTIEKEFMTIQQLAVDVVKRCKKIQKKMNNVLHYNLFSDKDMLKIRKVNRKIAGLKAYSFLDQYIEDIAVKKLKNVYQLSGNEKQDEKDTVDNTRVMYEAIIEAIDSLKEEVAADFQKVREGK